VSKLGRYRIAFMGTPKFAVPILQALCCHPDCEVVAVYSQPDRPAGRGRKINQAPVKAAAVAAGLPTLSPTGLRDAAVLAQFFDLNLDLAVVAAYGRILPPAFLQAPKLGCINVHASLLPAYRGASPIAHAILQGDTHTGVSLMQMDAGMDTGAVLHRCSLPIAAEDTCESLTEKLSQQAADALGALLPQLLLGQVQAVPQAALTPLHPHPAAHTGPAAASAMSYAPLLVKQEGQVDFNLSAAFIARQVRAFYPWPGTFVQNEGRRLGILAARAVDTGPGETPAKILQVSTLGLLVACGEGAVWLDQVKPAGGSAMSGAAWAMGRRLKAGALLPAVL
jgi:methionyl-tRNA formyltransferase